MAALAALNPRTLLRRVVLPVAICAGLAACDTPPLPDGADARPATQSIELPPMKRFGATRTEPPRRSNVALAQDFLDLTFEMESGRQLPRLTRFTEPVTVTVIGETPPPTLAQDLRALIARLRNEAGIDIRLARTGEAASITVNVISRRDLRRLQPDAACFILPNISTWEEFRRQRRSPALDWARLDRRTRAAIFLPGDVPPQEVRDCLHEEIAQALGPLNDLYRLPDSIFNDDNFHRVLTGFDMLMLRIHYDRTLANGMTKADVAARLPAILNRLNPRGAGRGGALPAPTPRAWINDIKRATGPGASATVRRTVAARAAALARARGWQDNRAAYALYVQGRLSRQADPELAVAALTAARRLYGAQPETGVHAAEVALHLAAFALSSGQIEATLHLTQQATGPLRQAQNAGELATALMIRAEALELAGRKAEARATRLDSIGWARYGIGDGLDILRRLRDIAALNPQYRGPS